jgi:hypothetical protein
MTAKVEPPGVHGSPTDELDFYDQQLLTAVVNHAERLGKTVRPLLVPTNNALYAVLQIAKSLPAQEVIFGASNKYTVEEQLDQTALYWINLHDGSPKGLTVHVVSQSHDLTFDLEGGNRIPKVAVRRARSVAQLRAAGVGVNHMLLVHDGSRDARDVFEWVVTMVAADIELDIVPVNSTEHSSPIDTIEMDRQWASQLGRTIALLASDPLSGQQIVQLLREGSYDAVVLPVAPSNANADERSQDWAQYVRQNSPCSVFLAAHPLIPREVVT